MRQPSDSDLDDPTLDDLLWELDVTTARPVPAAATTQAAEPREALDDPEPREARRAPKAPKRGRFHRPELESTWERLSRSRALQAAGAVVLLAGTAALVVVALSR